MAKPKSRHALCIFISMINYYRDMWKCGSALLALLTVLTSESVSWNWDEKHQKTFYGIKSIILRETLLSYLNFNNLFDIHTDASNLQLGAVISQNGKPIVFYSQKMIPA